MKKSQNIRKSRITIRIDNDVLASFRKRIHAAGGGNYQKLINLALRDHVAGRRDSLEATLRRVLREELPKRIARAPGSKRR